MGMFIGLFFVEKKSEKKVHLKGRGYVKRGLLIK